MKFSLVFDEKIDGPALPELSGQANNTILEINEEEKNSDSEEEIVK